MNRACIVLYCAQIETCILGSYLSAPRLLSHSTVTWGVRKSGSLREPRRNVARVTCTQSHRLSVCSKSFLCSWPAFKTSEHRKKSFLKANRTHPGVKPMLHFYSNVAVLNRFVRLVIQSNGAWHNMDIHLDSMQMHGAKCRANFNLNFGETLI